MSCRSRKPRNQSLSILTERKRNANDFFLVRYFVAFLNGDNEARTRMAALARGRPSLEDMSSHLEALVLARSGRLQEARRTSATAVEIAKQSGQRERAALFELATSVWEAFYGNAVSRADALSCVISGPA